MEEWDYAFDPDKNAWLIQERAISFEQIIALINSGHLVQVLEHHDRKRYPHQLLYEVDMSTNGVRLLYLNYLVRQSHYYTTHSAPSS